MRTVNLASWDSRFWAWLIDVIIVAAVLNLFLKPLSFWSFGIPNLWSFGIDGVVLFIYWTLLEGYTGQSIGKMALNLKVTDRKGDEIDLEKAAVESFGKAFILPIDCLVGWLAMSGEKLRLFNRLSNTIVIKMKYSEPEGIRYVKE